MGLSEDWLPEIVVLNRQERRVNSRRLAKLARSVFTAEVQRLGEGWEGESELNVVIGDDEWIRELNRSFRGEDVPTDVLAFAQGSGVTNGPLSGKQGMAEEGSAAGGLGGLGDVAISAETAARQAEELGHDFEEELAILLAHGILHLMGWRDETEAEKQDMMQRVKEVLAEAQLEGRPRVGPER